MLSPYTGLSSSHLYYYGDKAAIFAEKLVPLYRTIRVYTNKRCTLDAHRQENRKLHNLLYFTLKLWHLPARKRERQGEAALWRG